MSSIIHTTWTGLHLYIINIIIGLYIAGYWSLYFPMAIAIQMVLLTWINVITVQALTVIEQDSRQHQIVKFVNLC